MPELPEVETIRRDLEPLVVGRTVAGVEVDPGTIDLLTGLPIDALRAGLVGRRFVSLGRRGKYLLFGMDDGRTFVTHLRMTGRLVRRGANDPAIEYERGRLSLDDGHDLRWSDLRKFGTWDLVEDAAEVVGKLGPEPLDEAFTASFLRKLLAGRTAPVKAVLLDQRRVAGLGNIYVDEALFRRDGKPCYTCGTEIARSVVGGRGTHFCPRCQRRPRRRRSAGT